MYIIEGYLTILKVINVDLYPTRDWCISRQLWWGHRIPAYRIKYKVCIIPKVIVVMMTFTIVIVISYRANFDITLGISVCQSEFSIT